MRVAVLALLVGCSFEHGVALDDATGGDIATPDGDGRCGLFLDLCGSPAPPGPLHLVNADTINTDTDPRCLGVMQASGGDVCLVYATMVDIDSGASLTATGTRPLAIAASGALTVGGTIDVSSRISGQRGPASSDTACSFAATPELDLGGAGGGAGGSFGLAGGNGGTGDTDQSQGGSDGMGAPGMAGAPASVTALRGGCRGQAGANEDATGGVGGSGGHSGGALYLYAAESIQISGVIRATGAGGNGGQVQAGGGGGGSGGLVVIESPSIVVTGAISANGGGGGEGGARVGSTPVSGQPGADGMMGTTAAAGGMGSDNRFGYGGAGGASTEAV
ncbi:MAG TPA: hypothetical protein VFV99_10705, partial [Kofleriaceae bacterium]|nr:hypothetical protein [Kofleriaceae bacterium]